MQSTGGNSPITPEMTLAVGLRFLGGEYQKSLADIFGISISSTQRVVNNFLDAVHKKLAISIPKTTVELSRCAQEWDKLSGANHLFYGVVGAIDGWLACTENQKEYSIQLIISAGTTTDLV